MPTAFRSGPYRLFFYSADRTEPPHIHVARDEYVAKFWLNPVGLEANYGFPTRELVKIQGLLRDNVALLQKAWYGFFSD